VHAASTGGEAPAALTPKSLVLPSAARRRTAAVQLDGGRLRHRFRGTQRSTDLLQLM